MTLLNIHTASVKLESTVGYHELGKMFGDGKLFPYSMMAIPAKGESVFSPSFVNATEAAVRRLEKLSPGGARCSGITSLGTLFLPRVVDFWCALLRSSDVFFSWTQSRNGESLTVGNRFLVTCSKTLSTNRRRIGLALISCSFYLLVASVYS